MPIVLVITTNHPTNPTTIQGCIGMKHRNKVIALFLPLVGMMAALVIILDGTLAAAAQTAAPAPALIVKHTAVSPRPVTAANHTTALTALTTEQMATDAVCTSPSKILTIGDSITSGQNSTHDAGYRLPLFLKLRNDGYNIQMVGGKANGPTIGFDPYHEGVPGIETATVVDKMSFYLSNNNPNVILLHLGTNDMRKNIVVTATVIPQIDLLLNKVDEYETANQKTITVIVAQLISEACGSPATPACTRGVNNTTKYNAALAQLVNDRIAATGDSLVLVNMETGAGLDYSKPFVDFADELHPNDIGYEKMAVAWYDKLKNVLPATCATPPLILGNALTETAVFSRYSTQITASGAGNKTFSLNTFPTGMKIDANGRISWIPNLAQVGNNAVEVQVSSPNGTNTYAFNINVTNPGVAAIQEPYVATALKNNPFQFTVYISNTGSLTLTSIPVTFPNSPACNTNAGSLNPGTSTQITCNIASVTADFTHPVYVSATNSNSAIVNASDVATVDVINPKLTVVKTAVANTILYNSTANFTVTVTNSGDVDLTNVTVVDPVTPNCSKPNLGTLTPGQSTTYNCSLANATADINATATATGTHILGQVNGSGNVFVDVINPGIAMSITPGNQKTVSGNSASFTVTVTNTGDVTLNNVVVTNTVVPSCAKNNFSPIAVGAKVTYSCSKSNVTGDFYNSGTVTGDHVIGQVSANSSAFVDVFSADVDVTISANAYALLGSNVTFNILVKNTSGTTMSNIRLNDTATGCNAVITSLANGAQYNKNCTKNNVQTDISNTVYVTGTLPIIGDVSSSAFSIVDVINPAIGITITPNTQKVDVGDPAIFTVTVANTGDTNLTNVSINSTAVSACNKSIGTLNVGTDSTYTYTCQITKAATTLNNKVTVIGTHPLGTVTANKTAVLELSTFYVYIPMLIKP
jgi:uncharacterized repeat protein (TIGR01451 family)